ncbi:MAG: hypothetical protein HRU30_13335 [Rhodobacteraceae bacterium]|nr:hypothetical protein [Paracoccaceae bacterium]
MLGLGAGLHPAAPPVATALSLPPGFGWDTGRFPITVSAQGTSNLVPRDLVDPAIWSGVAVHVDGVAGDDANSGLGSADGDFSAAKRTIHAAFLAGNATGAPYRVIVKPGMFEESAFTKNGSREPDQPCAILGWNGAVRYRTGPHSVVWSDAGATSTVAVSAVKRAFRTDQTTPQGLYQELEKAADLASCQATLNSWFDDAGVVHVNIGAVPGDTDIALLRSFHGARFMSHVSDLYLENIHCEGGITGALHCDPVADRNIVVVNSSFKCSAPSNSSAPLDAVQMRRTNGLVAFFNCEASGGARDGFSFHEDGHAGMHVLTQKCRAVGNGISPATSVNGYTLHDAVCGIDLGGVYGWSRDGSEVHCVQSTHSWFVNTSATARDVDGTSVAFKCSNTSAMWLQNTTADAAGAATNNAIEANGGAVLTRNHTTIAGSEVASGAGSIGAF